MDGVILQGPWLFNSYPKINPDIELGVVPFPTVDGENRHWVGFVGDRNFWAARNTTSSREAQIRVIEWMTSADFAQHMIRDVNLLPFYQQDYSGVDSPVISEMEAQGFPVAPQANNQLDVIIQGDQACLKSDGLGASRRCLSGRSGCSEDGRAISFNTCYSWCRH